MNPGQQHLYRPAGMLPIKRQPQHSSTTAHLYASLSAPSCTLTTCCSLYLARRDSQRQLVSTMAAPPMRNNVFGICMLRSAP